MIINSTPDNLATFGGVASVSEFKIRNSAKAFGILSSGLYANKIRAIIRELSCNALDSHVAAKTDKNFDLHLPTQLAPYFSVRDYGTGLSHDDVLNIYTTYFESTKTESNDFIGALGLGSKSPFSYTDNFTVIAIKDGSKGIYSAFINDHGVPSVALMDKEDTDEPNGVEVKFAVTDRDDFYSFADEASKVFTYFSIKPNFTGADAHLNDVEYLKTDIVPNVSQRTQRGYQSENRAIMGSISYPIEIPRGSLATFDDVAFVEGQSLDIFFELGDIEFQASREGLQYTEKTIRAIKAKYQEVADVLEDKIAEEAEAIENMWDRVCHLDKLGRDNLWGKVVRSYVKKNKVPFLESDRSWMQLSAIQLDPKDLAEKFNISLRVFDIDKNWNGYSGNERVARERKTSWNNTHDLSCAPTVYFLRNPNNEKIWTRAKEHFKSQYKEDRRCYVLSAVDPDKDIDVGGFAKFIHSPPEDRFMDVEDLVKPERKKTQDKISILQVVQDRYSKKCTWSPLDMQVAAMDPNETYYYVPIKGFQGTTKSGADMDVKKVYASMRECNVEKLNKAKVYGVRAADLETVQSLSNWVLVDDLIKEVLNNYTSDDFLGLVLSWVDNDKEDLYYNKMIMQQLDPNSPVRKLHDKLPSSPVYGNRSLFDLATDIGTDHNLKDLEQEAKDELDALRNRYPMFKLIRGRYFDDPAVIEYINIVDKQKGLN